MPQEEFKRQQINDIEHFHFESVSSTQTKLRELIKNEQFESFRPIVLTTNTQTAGMGRQGNRWHSNKNSITLSFTFPLFNPPTLTPILISKLIADFFNKQNIKLKWPNDLMTEKGEKCGGVLCHKDHDSFLIAGVGINLFNDPTLNEIDSRYEIGSVFGNDVFEKQGLELRLYQYLIEKMNVSEQQLRESWNSYSIHNNKNVSIEDGQTKVTGLFMGIGPYGEATIKEDNGNIKSLFSGSLTIS